MEALQFPKQTKRKKREPNKEAMFPKNPRLDDKKVIEQFKKDVPYCEYPCVEHGPTLEVAHIEGKGTWGPDIRENLCRLCGPASFGLGAHGKHHKGIIKDEELWGIAAKREGKTVEECKALVRLHRIGKVV